MTIAPPEHDLDITLLEEMEFELPCEIVEGPASIPCVHGPAAWIMVLRQHDPHPSGQRTMLICQRHYEAITNGAMGFCYSCVRSIKMQDHVVRLEPIKGEPK
jgi:hypothetical protein